MSISKISSFRSSISGAGKPASSAVKSAQGTLRTALNAGHTVNHPSVQSAVQTLQSAGQVPKLTPAQAGKVNQ